MNKIKIWKILLILIIFIVILFAAFTFRKILILNKLQAKLLEFEKNDNIYSKIDSEVSTIENFTMGDSNKLIFEFKDKPLTIVQIKNKDDYEHFTFYEEVKEVSINNDVEDAIIREKVENFVETYSLLYKIRKSISSKIHTETIDGKQYYVIDHEQNNKHKIVDNPKSSEVYIDKETGVPLKLVLKAKDDNSNITEHIVNYTYETNVVTDADFIKPSIEGYKIK